MYLQTNSIPKAYCNGFNLSQQSPTFSGLSENPVSIGDTNLALCQDDGFVLFECNPANFERIVFSDGVLALTNEPEPVPCLAEIQALKLAEISQTCNTTITAGCTMTLSDGTTGHISMKDEDQINLMSALAAVQQGAAGYPYHLDGDLCRIFSAEDIAIMVSAATRHKLYHTTYCNHLNVWVRRCETVEDVQAITYGASLPDDLAANMAEVLSHAG